tara:strand:+ start:1007 stop:1180 length:174 start_codon:yes stop_codon:yes gene_type:complete
MDTVFTEMAEKVKNNTASVEVRRAYELLNNPDKIMDSKITGLQDIIDKGMKALKQNR